MIGRYPKQEKWKIRKAFRNRPAKPIVESKEPVKPNASSIQPKTSNK